MTPLRPNWDFFRTSFAVYDSALPRVTGRTLIFGLFALAVYLVDELTPAEFHLGISVAPYEIAGSLLAALLVLRTNAGYDRWWEARRQWGSIVNQSRNLAIAALTNGPDDARWRDRVVRLTVAFAHVVRHRLRSERSMPRVVHLLGEEESRRIAAAEHMPSYVSFLIGQTLRDGRERLGMDPFVYLQVDRERALLIEDVGSCERILKTPLPRVYAIEIHRFIVVFLVTLPFALIDKLDYHWLNPIVTAAVAYVLLALDQIGIDLQNPFDVRRLGHLDLDTICETIEHNLMTLLITQGVLPQGDEDREESKAVQIL